MESAEEFSWAVVHIARTITFRNGEEWEAKDEIQQMLTARDAAIRAECAPTWISTKERLPEDMQRVLVSIYGFTCPTLYTADFIKREIGGIFVPVYDDLTAEHPMSMSQYSISMAEFDIQPSHWMPLPEPPKAAL